MVTDEQKYIKEQAEFYAYKHLPMGCFDFDLYKQMLKIITRTYEEGYNNGLAEDRKEKWHDLRKDPNDLPERMGINSKEVYVAYSDNNCTDFASYNFNTKSWERSEDNAIATIVIAWCELPKFEE